MIPIDLSLVHVFYPAVWMAERLCPSLHFEIDLSTSAKIGEDLKTLPLVPTPAYLVCVHVTSHAPCVGVRAYR